MIVEYLDQRLIPLAAGLSRMLQKIETELADEKIGAAERWRLRLRAGLIRRMLRLNPSAGDEAPC